MLKTSQLIDKVCVKKSSIKQNKLVNRHNRVRVPAAVNAYPRLLELFKCAVTFLKHIFSANVTEALLKLANYANVAFRLAEVAGAHRINLAKPPRVLMNPPRLSLPALTNRT